VSVFYLTDNVKTLKEWESQNVFFFPGLWFVYYKEDPEISVEIEVMKTEVMKYQTHEERKDSETHSHFVLRSVLTNSPNSQIDL
jgi:hypothetical protein